MNNVIILYSYFAPAYKAGGPVQSLQTLVTALGKEIRIRIVCSNQDHDGTILPVKANDWVSYNAHAKVWFSKASTLRKCLQVARFIWQQKPDVLFINGIYSLPFTLLPLLLGGPSRKILSVRGMLNPGALSQKPFKKKIYLQCWKLMGLHRKCTFHATNEYEKSCIQQIFGADVKVWVVTNLPRMLDFQQPIAKKTGKLKLVSVAMISPMKNHLLILNALRNITMQVQYDIYGPVKDENYWDECKEVIEQLPDNIQVCYHGYIPPDEVNQALAKAHIMILPSKSENFGHAIYEAFTAGRPVITSHHTPWNRLQEEKAGINVGIESEKEIRDAIVYFSGLSMTEWREWCHHARRYAIKAIDICNIRQQYMRMFQDKNPASQQ